MRIILPYVSNLTKRRIVTVTDRQGATMRLPVPVAQREIDVNDDTKNWAIEDYDEVGCLISVAEAVEVPEPEVPSDVQEPEVQEPEVQEPEVQEPIFPKFKI